MNRHGTEPARIDKEGELTAVDDGASVPKVVSLDDYRDPIGRPAAPTAEIARLYRNTSSRNLARAVELLKEGRQALGRALEACAEDDELAADDAVQELQSLLPELFLCRDLGEGYASIISGIHFAFENRGGDPLNEEQIGMMAWVVDELSREPFIPTTGAYKLLARLEDRGLLVTPKSLSYLFDDESHA